MTFADLDAPRGALAAGLPRRRRRGDRVALLLPNGVEAAVAIYGTLRAGAAFVPLNPTIKADKLAYVAARLRRVAVADCDAALAPLAERGRAREAPSVRHVARARTTSSRADGAAARPADRVDLAAIIYTSGSTGGPKGVTLTHANMTFAAGSIVEYLGMQRGRPRPLRRCRCRSTTGSTSC